MTTKTNDGARPGGERVSLPRVQMTTRVLRAGTGSPVLLLHGSPDSADEWRGVMGALGDTCASAAPDLPGLGHCDAPPASFDFSHEANGRFLDDLLDALSIREPVVLVVHDIGGIVGLPWAVKNLGRVRGVVITNTVVFERFAWFGLARLWGRSDFVGRALASAVMWLLGRFGGRRFRRAFARASPELGAEHVERMTRQFALDAKSKRSTLRLFRKMVPHRYFDGFDRMVRDLVASVPVRVLWGRGDPYIPERFADAFGDAPREIIEGGGHWVPISAADRVAAAVQAILALRDGAADTHAPA